MKKKKNKFKIFFSRGIYLSLALATTLLNIACNPSINNPVIENSDRIVEEETETIEQLNITVIPHQSPKEQQDKIQVLADYLEEELNTPVNINITKDYLTSVDLLVSGKVQMAYLGAVTYIEAKQKNPNLVAILAPIEATTGRPWYQSVIVANSQQGINTIADLQGKKMSFVSESSTSGYVVPTYYLVNNNIDPKTYFASITFAGSHDKNVIALKSGEVDAIAIDQQTFMRSQKSGQLPTNQYKMIWQSDPIPNPPIVVNTKILPTNLISQLKKVLVNAPEGIVDLTGSNSNGYTIVEDKDYQPIQDIQEYLKKQAK